MNSKYKITKFTKGKLENIEDYGTRNNRSEF